MYVIGRITHGGRERMKKPEDGNGSNKILNRAEIRP